MQHYWHSFGFITLIHQSDKTRIMSQKIILAAQQFSSEHFSDLYMNQEQFRELIEDSMHAFPDLVDKVVFLTEVIRLGNIYMQDSVTVLQQMEEHDISKTGINTLY